MRGCHFKGDAVIRRLVWLFSLLVIAPANVQAEQLPIKTYTTADGLAHDNINRIVQDSHGFLWFCTAEGISRFDGYNFTNYTSDQGLPHRSVNDLLETRNGIYWVATSGGICRFNPTGDRLRMFVVYHFSEDERAQIVNALTEDHTGTIWCGTVGGLYRLDQVNGQWTFSFVDIGLPTNHIDDISVHTILEDRRGALWVGAFHGLYRRSEDGRVERYTTHHGLPYNDIRALIEDREGRVWVATTLGLCRIVPEPNLNQPVVARVYTVKDGLPHNVVESLFQSSDGRLWVGTADGLCEVISTDNKDSRKLRSYTIAHGLSDHHIGALAEDRDGNLWIGTESGGAMKMARNGLTTYVEADGLRDSRIASIFEDQAGQLCVISSKPFIHQFDGIRFNATRPNIPRHITYFSWGWNQLDFQDREGQWWVPTWQGLCRFPKVSRVEQLGHTRPLAVYTTKDGLTGDQIFRLYEDSRGDIWVCVEIRDSLVRWERATGTFHRYGEADGLAPSNGATAFCEDKGGNLWIGFYEGGLARYRDGRFTLLSAGDGVPVGMIRGLYLDHAGRLWVATSRGGLARVDDPGADNPRFVVYTTAEGLTSNQVSCVTEDYWGRIYIGTGRGLDQLDLATGHIKHYTIADGLGNNFVNVAYRDRTGALWFGTLQGLSRLMPEPDRPQQPPPILIAGVRVAGVSQPISELGETQLSGLELGPNRNQIQIDFFGLRFEMGEALRYQFLLEGADLDWSAPTAQRTVNYPNLSPGRYRFLVRAVSADGATSQAPAIVAFKILPPIWQRWWLLTLVALLVGLLAHGTHRYRVGRLVELERVRTRIATDLHDDIGSSLSQVAILSEVARQQVSNDDSKVVKPLSMISRISLESMDAMSDIVWAINPQKDRLHDLTQRMRRFASDVFTASNIQFGFHAPREVQDTRMGPDLRRQVFLIFKESVNNIVRHSCCTLADIELRVEGAWLILKVSDNGKGFDIEQSSEGNGLVNMRGRAATMNGDLTVISHNGEGTTLILKVPFARRGWQIARQKLKGKNG
jgi:ligand-binding sensor domain-containing protein/two-component sensor histidine kinase